MRARSLVFILGSALLVLGGFVVEGRTHSEALFSCICLVCGGFMLGNTTARVYKE